MKIKVIGYWAITAFLAFAMVSGGAAELLRRPDNIDGLVRLGYPAYFASIIGFWKVLGGLTVLAPRLPRLKEWAYAGIFFNMTRAAVSHAVSGDAAWHVIVTGALALLTVASWALRPQSRSLGVLVPV
ncbi:MAG TPA: DoxX family protein [Gemmatimonadales bacterium]|nr:DoxX family protein [Gemmatimonadales bacterium]